MRDRLVRLLTIAVCLLLVPLAGHALAAPSISSLSPASGAVGASVTITDTGFGATKGSSTVTFNGATATNITSWSATSIVAVVPSGAAASGNVGLQYVHLNHVAAATAP